MTREAEEREKGLRRDLEQLRSQQQQTLGTLDTRIDAMMKRRNHAIMDRLNCATCISTDHHLSACPTYKQGMKAIGFSVRGVIAKLGHRWAFFCNFEGHFKTDCPEFVDAVADIKHPRLEDALSGVKASKERETARAGYEEIASRAKRNE